MLKALKEDGYHVTLNANKTGINILKYDPNIDEFIQHDTSIPADERLDKHLKELEKGYDKAINLCESIEGSLAKVYWRDDFHKSKEELHAECNKNFYDFTLEWGGYPAKGWHGDLYFSNLEEKRAREFRRKHKGKFLVIWSMSGSSPHKVYPYSEYVIKIFLNRHPDAFVVTVGDVICQMIEPKGKRIKNCSGVWNIRKSFAATKYADLVVGPDTGLMHGAGCFDTPKILFLSSNTEENLSKTWKNCTNLVPSVDCHPCHRLHYSKDYCPLDGQIGTPVCMTKLKAQTVLDAMEYVYQEWKNR